MIRAVAYKMQERVIGGLSAASRRLLCAEEPAPVRRRRGLRPGTVLIREWPDHDCRARGDLSRRTPPLAVRGCPPDHRRPLVGAAVLRRDAMTATPPARRGAVYTRKSSEEGLAQDFDSLHAQREACEAFIHRTWRQPDGLAKASFI